MYPGLTDTDCRIAELRHAERVTVTHRHRATEDHRKPGGAAAIRRNTRPGWLAALATRVAAHPAGPGRRFRIGAAR